MMDMSAKTAARTRNILFLFFTIGAFAIFSQYLLELYYRTQESELYSHIILIPFVSGYFFYYSRKEITAQSAYGLVSGPLFILGAAILFILGNISPGLSENDYLAVMVLSSVIFWAGGFLFFHGARSAVCAAFPLLFLVFMVPVPESMLNKIIYMLQSGSAEVASVLFSISGTPVHRDGFVFHLPGLNIEVAKQCSGIRSSLVLFIAGVIASHLFLKSWWRKGLLMLFIIPIAIFKNGLRIMALTLFGYYVDERAFSGAMHSRGGILFFLLAMLMLGGVLWALKRSERENR